MMSQLDAVVWTRVNHGTKDKIAQLAKRSRRKPSTYLREVLEQMFGRDESPGPALLLPQWPGLDGTPRKKT